MVPSCLPGASIIIPVFNRVAFTRQCLDRIERHTSDVPHEIIVVDNGSTDGTQAYLAEATTRPAVQYHRTDQNLGFARANNLGAQQARYSHLLFLNNDTLVEPHWLSEMMRLAGTDAGIGVVGIKQLFPYTRSVYHTGIVFTRGPRPIHLYPHADANAVHVNRQREYQAVNGACMLIGAELFAECGGFDEAYVNGYEDVDLCLAVRQRGLKVICCTSAFIYHYAQISEGRTADDDRNLARLISKWGDTLHVDEDDYFRRDASDIARSTNAVDRRAVPSARATAELPDSSSPYWQGIRVSVIIPVMSGTGVLPEQLEALARQSVLPKEFEAIIADRGTGEAEHIVRARPLPYAVQHLSSRDHQGAGDPLNDAVGRARGELVLFLDGNSVPDERLLEEHLLAHARLVGPHAVVVGEVEYDPGRHGTFGQEIRGTEIRQLVSAPESDAKLEFTRLDLGNASFKRVFIAQAWASGVRLDPMVHETSLQGADLALQLRPFGLRVNTAPAARTYRKHLGDVESLASREFSAGCDAVRIFRSNPTLDPTLDVKWIADSRERAVRVAGQPQLQEAIADFDGRTDQLMRTLVDSLDELIAVTGDTRTDAATHAVGGRQLLEASQGAADLVSDVSRTKGKVRAWYAGEVDGNAVTAAEPLLSAARKIEWLAARGPRRMTEPGAGTASHGTATLRARLSEVEDQFDSQRGAGAARPTANLVRQTLILLASRTGVKSRLRAIDYFIERRLRERRDGKWLARYLAVRARVRPYFV